MKLLIENKTKYMTQQNDDQYDFEEVKSNPQQLFSNIDGVSDKLEHPNPIPGVFESLYDEIIKRCDPANFLNPYDQEKVRISNELYSKSKTLKNKNDEKVLKEIRKRAIKELGIKFSTIELYEKLEKICNVQNYTGDNYNQDFVNLANTLFGQIKKYADDIEKLEEIDTQTGDLVAELQRRKEEELEKQKWMEKEKKLREEINAKRKERISLIDELDMNDGLYGMMAVIIPVLLGALLMGIYENNKELFERGIVICTIILIACYILEFKSYKKNKKTINSKIAVIEQWLQEYGTQSLDGSETEAKELN